MCFIVNLRNSYNVRHYETSRHSLQMKSVQSLFPILAAILGSIFIDSSGVFVRLSNLGPIVTGFYRTLFSVPFLFLWILWEKKTKHSPSLLPQTAYGCLIAAGLFLALDLILWNWSIEYTTIVNSTLFNNTAAFFVPLFMWILYKEKLSSLYFFAVLICFIGAICLLANSLSISLNNVRGDCVALASGMLLALYLISLKRIREEITTGLLMFWTGLFSLVCLGIFAHFAGESFWPMTLKDAVSIFSQALLVHVLGHGFLAYSLGKIPANYVALLLFLGPVTAGILGWAIYDEHLGLLKIAGILLIVLGVIAAKRKV